MSITLYLHRCYTNSSRYIHILIVIRNCTVYLHKYIQVYTYTNAYTSILRIWIGGRCLICPGGADESFLRVQDSSHLQSLRGTGRMVVVRWPRTSSPAWVWNPDGKNAVVPWPTKGYWIPPLASDFASFYGWNGEIWGSRDGSDTDAEGGLAIRGQPCVWCGGGLGMPRPTGRFEERDSVVVRGWLKQLGRSWISFYKLFFGKSFTSWCERLKHWWNIFLESIFEFLFGFYQRLSTMKEEDMSYPLLCIKWSNILEISKGSFWDTFQRKNASKIHPNSPLFLRVDQWKKTPRPCTDESEAKCAPYEYFAHGAGKVPRDRMGCLHWDDWDEVFVSSEVPPNKNWDVRFLPLIVKW